MRHNEQPSDHPADYKSHEFNGQVQNPEHRENGYSPRRDQQPHHSEDEHENNNQRRERQRSQDSHGSRRGGSQGRDQQLDKKPIQIYVGHIGHSIDEHHLKDLYREYGKVADVVMKGKYAFVEFESQKDADAAIDATNGIDFHGYKLKVEYPSKFNYNKCIL